MAQGVAELPQDAEQALFELTLLVREELSRRCGKGKHSQVIATIFNNDGNYDVEVGGKLRKKLPKRA